MHDDIMNAARHLAKTIDEGILKDIEGRLVPPMTKKQIQAAKKDGHVSYFKAVCIKTPKYISISPLRVYDCYRVMTSARDKTKPGYGRVVPGFYVFSSGFVDFLYFAKTINKFFPYFRRVPNEK